MRALLAILLGLVCPLTVTIASDSDAMAILLAAEEYVSAPLTPCGVGQFSVDVTISGRAYAFLVDTGSSFSLIDPDVCKELNLPLHPKQVVKMAEMTGKRKQHRLTQPVFIHVGRCLLPPLVFALVDMEPIRIEDGDGARPEIHGILGSNALQRHEAVIDYRHRRLFLRGVTLSQTGTPPRPSTAPRDP